VNVMRRLDEERVAQEYAVKIIEGREKSEWMHINRDIIERWSDTALRRIKRRAWAIVEERPSA